MPLKSTVFYAKDPDFETVQVDKSWSCPGRVRVRPTCGNAKVAALDQRRVGGVRWFWKTLWSMKTLAQSSLHPLAWSPLRKNMLPPGNRTLAVPGEYSTNEPSKIDSRMFYGAVNGGNKSQWGENPVTNKSVPQTMTNRHTARQVGFYIYFCTVLSV